MAYELPFILHDNVLESGTVTITSEASGFPKENLYDWLDWTYWKGTSTVDQVITIDTGAATEVDTIAILGHNLDETGGIYIDEDNDPLFPTPDNLLITAVANSNPFYFTNLGGTQRYYRIGIYSGASVPFSAVILLGKKMTIPVGPDFNWDPDMQKIMSEKYLNYSGRMVGSAVKYSEREMEVPFKRLAQSFINSDLLPFLENHYGTMTPFFFVPDPGDVFGTDKIYYLTAPDNPEIRLPVYNDQISFRNWTMVARGFRQSIFR